MARFRCKSCPVGETSAGEGAKPSDGRRSPRQADVGPKTRAAGRGPLRSGGEGGGGGGGARCTCPAAEPKATERERVRGSGRGKRPGQAAGGSGWSSSS